MEDIVLVGSSGHARSVAEVVEREARYRIVGLVDSFRRPGETAFGYDLIGTEHDLRAFCRERAIGGLLVAIGDNWQRHRMVLRLRDLIPGVTFVRSTHPSAVIGRDVQIGEGTVLMAGTLVNADCRIGEFCFLNTRSSLDHDSVLGDFASLGPGVTTGGKVRVGAFSAIGVGATVSDARAVGEHALVGAGAVVVRDIPPRTVAYGVPARVKREREVGEPYL